EVFALSVLEDGLLAEQVSAMIAPVIPGFSLRARRDVRAGLGEELIHLVVLAPHADEAQHARIVEQAACEGGRLDAGLLPDVGVGAVLSVVHAGPEDHDLGMKALEVRDEALAKLGGVGPGDTVVDDPIARRSLGEAVGEPSGIALAETPGVGIADA